MNKKNIVVILFLSLCFASNVFCVTVMDEFIELVKVGEYKKLENFWKEKKGSINIHSKKGGKSLLHIAAENNNKDSFRFLYEREPKLLLEKDQGGNIPLSSAILDNRVTSDMVGYMLSQYNDAYALKNVLSIKKNKLKPLELALKLDASDDNKKKAAYVVAYLISNAVDYEKDIKIRDFYRTKINSVLDTFQLNLDLVKKMNDNNILHMVARHGSLEDLMFFVDKFALPNARDKRGETPFHKAVLSTRDAKNKVIILFAYADETIKNKFKQTPEDIAKNLGKRDIVQVFGGARLKVSNDSSELWKKYRKRELVRYIQEGIKKGVSHILGKMSHVDENINWLYHEIIGGPIHLAIRLKRLEILKILLDSGKADINFKDPAGRTPILLAIVERWDDGIKELIDRGVKIKNDDIKKVSRDAGRGIITTYLENNRQELIDALIPPVATAEKIKEIIKFLSDINYLAKKGCWCWRPWANT